MKELIVEGKLDSNIKLDIEEYLKNNNIQFTTDKNKIILNNKTIVINNSENNFKTSRGVGDDIFWGGYSWVSKSVKEFIEE